MKGNGFASFPCSHSWSLAPSVFHRAVGILVQTMDFSSRKSLASQLPGHFRHKSAQPLYRIPSRALPGLKTSRYGTIARKKSGQDSLVRDRGKYSENKSKFDENMSQKGLISALSTCTGGSNTKDGEKVSGQKVTVFHEDSDSESEEEEKNVKKKDKKDKRLKGMQGEEEDSETDSDYEKKKRAMKKSLSNCIVEVVGTFKDDSDSESNSDEEKQMKKKMKADEKELKKQAKKERKEMKALKKIKCKDRDSEAKDNEEKKMVSVVYVEDTNRQDRFYIEEPDSDISSELEREEDDVVEVVPNALDEDEYEEEDFELVGDEDLSNEIEKEIEDSFEEYEDEDLDDDFWEDDEGEAMVGDGGDGGGVVLGDAQWERKALDLAEVVVKELGSDFAIYAFKASPDGLVRVRLDKLSDQYGSPTMTEIETFSRKYTAILDSSEIIPENVAVEVSSPGAERMLKIPDELERFKQLPMYVQYFEDESCNVVNDGVLELDSLDPESGMIVWKLANVKLNREQAGKGRPLNSKQKKWRAHVPLKFHKLVRLYLDV